MFGTFKNYAEQVKMAGKFNEDNKDYEKFVKKQTNFINEINDDKKIDFFAQLTRCYLLIEMGNALYYKLARFLIMCTPQELDYIVSFDYEETTNLTAICNWEEIWKCITNSIFFTAENYFEEQLNVVVNRLIVMNKRKSAEEIIGHCRKIECICRNGTLKKEKKYSRLFMTRNRGRSGSIIS